MSEQINVAFLWHMHQPWYGDPHTGQLTLPWVRLHATKDYVDMAAILENFPTIHQTFNLTPCLIEQLRSHEKGRQDAWAVLAARPTEELNEAEMRLLADQCTFAHRDHMVTPYPRYYELIARVQRRQALTIQELRDLTVWFNWVWIDPFWRSQDPALLEIEKKAQNFTEEEKQIVLDKQSELIRRVLPTYRRLQEKGQIEVSTTPYAHPILPLLLDNSCAREATLHLGLPRSSFAHPEDVREHLHRAATIYQDCFGRPPRGLWPSEGSVSQAILPYVVEAGFRWMATDEAILWKTLGGAQQRRVLYGPYRVQAEGGDLTVLFRDRELSDLIGFTYSHQNAQEAAQDFMKRLHRIREDAQGDVPLVSVILDGENAWEHYSEDGREFLLRLYEAISKDPAVRCVGISEYVDAHPPRHALGRLATGSWIRGDFTTWIGEGEKNRAWDLLVFARDAYAQAPDCPGKKEAYQHLLWAEGSDWFWWYGPEHTSAHDAEFDRLFREHLAQVYTNLNLPVPSILRKPISRYAVPGMVSPVGWMTPELDGQVTDYFEWLYAGRMECALARGAMSPGKERLSSVGWGCDARHWHLRFDGLDVVSSHDLTLVFIGEKPAFRIEVGFRKEGVRAHCVVGDGTDLVVLKAAWQHIVELSVPLELLGVKHGDEIVGQIQVREGVAAVETLPAHGAVAFNLPEESDEEKWWSA